MSSPLSAETQKNLIFATQNIAPQDGDAHKIPPAQQARAALADNPELGDRPFGALVSRIARGLPLLAPNSSSQSNEETSPNPASAEPINPPLDIPATEEQTPVALSPVIQDQTPTALDLVIEELANPPATDPLVGEILIPPEPINPPLDILATEEQTPVALSPVIQDQTPTALDLVIEELANPPATDPLVGEILIPPDVIA